MRTSSAASQLREAVDLIPGKEHVVTERAAISDVGLPARRLEQTPVRGQLALQEVELRTAQRVAIA